MLRGKKQNGSSSVLLLLTPAQGRVAAVQPAKTTRVRTKKAMFDEKPRLIRTAGRPGGLHDALQALCRLFHCRNWTGTGRAGGLKALAGNTESAVPPSKPLAPRQPDQATRAPQRAGLAPVA